MFIGFLHMFPDSVGLNAAGGANAAQGTDAAKPKKPADGKSSESQQIVSIFAEQDADKSGFIDTPEAKLNESLNKASDGQTKVAKFYNRAGDFAKVLQDAIKGYESNKIESKLNISSDADKATEIKNFSSEIETKIADTIKNINTDLEQSYNTAMAKIITDNLSGMDSNKDTTLDTEDTTVKQEANKSIMDAIKAAGLNEEQAQKIKDSAFGKIEGSSYGVESGQSSSTAEQKVAQEIADAATEAAEQAQEMAQGGNSVSSVTDDQDAESTSDAAKSNGNGNNSAVSMTDVQDAENTSDAAKPNSNGNNSAVSMTDVQDTDSTSDAVDDSVVAEDSGRQFDTNENGQIDSADQTVEDELKSIKDDVKSQIESDSELQSTISSKNIASKIDSILDQALKFDSIDANAKDAKTKMKQQLSDIRENGFESAKKTINSTPEQGRKITYEGKPAIQRSDGIYNLNGQKIG